MPRFSRKFVDHLCEAIPGMHSFTGCDSVSAFPGKGKVKVLKLLMKDEKFIELFRNFGTNWQVSSDHLPSLEEFTRELYGQRDTSVNNVKYIISKDGRVSSDQLPPCQNALIHALILATRPKFGAPP